MRRVETGERHVGEVPLPLFQGSAFKEKRYLDVTLEIVLEGVEALKIERREPLHVCTGYVLSKARDELVARGYNVVHVKITGGTQDLAEREFISSLVKLGVGDTSMVSGMRSYDAFLAWIREHLENRERFVKTGWSAWPRLREESET